MDLAVIAGLFTASEHDSALEATVLSGAKHRVDTDLGSNHLHARPFGSRPRSRWVLGTPIVGDGWGDILFASFSFFFGWGRALRVRIGYDRRLAMQSTAAEGSGVLSRYVAQLGIGAVTHRTLTALGANPNHA